MEDQVLLYDMNERFSVLQHQIELNKYSNLQDLGIISEDFFKDILNIAYGWNLRNANEFSDNHKAIDLYYLGEKEKICIQVSSTDDPEKIRKTLRSDFFADNTGYEFFFLCIGNNKDKIEGLKKKKYAIPANLIFEPKRNIIGIGDIIKHAEHNYDKLCKMHRLVEARIRYPSDITRMNHTLSIVIQVLSDTDLKKIEYPGSPFEINEKIRQNDLTYISDWIEDYANYCQNLESVYETYEREGRDLRFHVMERLSGYYMDERVNNEGQNISASKIFVNLINRIKQEVMSSANKPDVTEEQLDFSARILITDAFIACRVFEKPEAV